jgi:hypothetical protein
MGSSVAFTSYRLVACEEYLADKRFYAESIIDRVFRGYFNKFRVRRFVFASLDCFLLDSFLLQSTLHDHGEDDAAAASSSPAANDMNDMYLGYVGGRLHACMCTPIFLNFMMIVVVAVVLVVGAVTTSIMTMRCRCTKETSPCSLWDDVSSICGSYIPSEVMSQLVAHEQRLVRDIGYSTIARSQSPLHVLCKPYWSAMHPRPYGDNDSYWDSSSFGLRIRDNGATLILQIAEQFEKFRSGTNGGVIFCGQPGWGMIRCLLAQVAAIDTHRNFICINGVDMLSMCESAGNVRKVFNFARASSPCVLFIEDLDSIRGRSAANEQFLMELDSAFRSRSDDVFVIASSNKHHIDPELLLPGRLDLQVLVARATYRECFDQGHTRVNFQNHLYRTGCERDVDLGLLSATYHESHVMTQGGVAIICLQAAKFAIIEELGKLFAPGADKEQDRAQRDGHHRDHLYLAKRHFEQCKQELFFGNKRKDFEKICRIERPAGEEHCTLKSLAKNYPQFVPHQQDPHQEEIWLVSQPERHSVHMPGGGAFLYGDIIGPLFFDNGTAAEICFAARSPVRRAAVAPAPFTRPLTAEEEMSACYD